MSKKFKKKKKAKIYSIKKKNKKSNISSQAITIVGDQSNIMLEENKMNQNINFNKFKN